MGAGEWGGGVAGGEGGRGVVNECYVTIRGCTIQRYEALQGGVGGVKFSGKKRYVTLEWPLC